MFNFRLKRPQRKHPRLVPTSPPNHQRRVQAAKPRRRRRLAEPAVALRAKSILMIATVAVTPAIRKSQVIRMIVTPKWRVKAAEAAIKSKWVQIPVFKNISYCCRSCIIISLCTLILFLTIWKRKNIKINLYFQFVMFHQIMWFKNII